MQGDRFAETDWRALELARGILTPAPLPTPERAAPAPPSSFSTDRRAGQRRSAADRVAPERFWKRRARTRYDFPTEH